MIVTISDGRVVCDWFVTCANPAEGIAWHPALEWVPCCARCAEVVGAELHDADVEFGRESDGRGIRRYTLKRR